MVSRERLLRLASRADELANAKRVRLAAHAVLLGGVVFVIVRLRSIFHNSHVHLTQASWGWLAGAAALGVVGVLGSSLIWLFVLSRLGSRVRWQTAAIYLQAQLGKYVPGAVWQYAGRGAMAHAHGLSVRLVARSLPIELTATLCAGAAFAFLALGWWGAIAIVAAIATAAVVGARLSEEQVFFRITAQSIPLYAVTWLAIGVSFWMTGRAFLHIGATDLALYTGAFAAAWIVGLIAIYAPGGIGVREAIVVAILGPRIGSAEALVVAAASRAVFTLADLIAAGISLPLLRRPAQGTAEPAPPL